MQNNVLTAIIPFCCFAWIAHQAASAYTGFTNIRYACNTTNNATGAPPPLFNITEADCKAECVKNSECTSVEWISVKEPDWKSAQCYLNTGGNRSIGFRQPCGRYSPLQDKRWAFSEKIERSFHLYDQPYGLNACPWTWYHVPAKYDSIEQVWEACTNNLTCLVVGAQRNQNFNVFFYFTHSWESGWEFPCNIPPATLAYDMVDKKCTKMRYVASRPRNDIRGDGDKKVFDYLVKKYNVKFAKSEKT